MAPAAERKRPAAHAVQRLAPLEAWYWPEAQGLHVAEPRPAVVPAAQRVALVLPVAAQ